MIAAQSVQAAPDQKLANANEKIFLQAQYLTDIKPLQLHFFKGEVQLSKNNRALIQSWADKILSTSKSLKYDIPIFIHSSAGFPTGIRDLTPDTAQHEAIRVAFNRGLLAQNLLEQTGIKKNRLILKAQAKTPSPHSDSLTITIRQ